MRNILNPGSSIVIKGTVYTIEKLVGKGSSCVVYKATRPIKGQARQQNCLLKEFNPKDNELERDSNFHIVPANENDERFHKELERFGRSIDTMIEIYNEIDSNNTPFIDSESCKGYAVMPQLYGTTFGKWEPADLYALFLRIMAVTRIIKQYHACGLLHLDIKPDNIFCCDDSDCVQIVDYDSIVCDPCYLSERNGAADIRNEDVDILFSSNWAAAELVLGLRDQIGPQTDLFAIGELLYFKLFGKHSDLLDRNTYAHFDFEHSAMFKGISPTLYDRLTEFFHKTLSTNPKLRYQTAGDLLDALEKMSELTKMPYIRKPHLKDPPSFFIGRDEKFDEVYKKLSETGILFVQGFGGIGKTAFAAKYEENYGYEYDCVCHTESNNPISEIELDNYDAPDNDPKKFDSVRLACESSRVLVAFDNAERFDNDLIRKLSELPCHKLFLTRNFDCNDKQRHYIELEELSQNEAFEIFVHYYGNGKPISLSSDNKKYVDEIIESFACHTLFVELAAKSIGQNGYTLKEFADKVKKLKTRAGGKAYVYGGSKIKFDDKSLHEQLEMLFELSNLEENEIFVLACLSLLPSQGADKRIFNNTESAYINTINKLVKKGWIQERRKVIDGDYHYFISLHPLIEELAEEKLYQEPHHCGSFLKWLSCRAHDDGMVYVISAVADRLLKGRNFNMETVIYIDIPEAAELLVSSCEISSGGFNAWVKRLVRALEIYSLDCESMNCVENILGIIEKLCKIYLEHDNVMISDTLIERLDDLLETLTNNIDYNEPTCELFRMVFCILGMADDNDKINRSFEKLASKFKIYHGGSGLARACYSCGLGLYEAEKYNAAKKCLMKVRDECNDPGSQEVKRQSDELLSEIQKEESMQRLCKIGALNILKDAYEHTGDPKLLKKFNALKNEPVQLKDGNPRTQWIPKSDFIDKTIDEQINISLGITNMRERAGLLLLIAYNALSPLIKKITSSMPLDSGDVLLSTSTAMMPDYDKVLKCLEEMKNALKNDFAFSDAVKLIEDGITLLQAPNENTLQMVRGILDKLYSEDSLIPPYEYCDHPYS